MGTREARIRWKEGAPQGGGRNVWQPRETRWLISVKTNPRPAIRHPRPSLPAHSARAYVSGIVVSVDPNTRVQMREEKRVWPPKIRTPFPASAYFTDWNPRSNPHRARNNLSFIERICRRLRTHLISPADFPSVKISFYISRIFLHRNNLILGVGMLNKV